MLRYSEHGMSARDVCRILFRHRRKATLFLLLTVSVSLAAVLLMPRKYISEAKLLVKMNLRLDPTATNSGQAYAMNYERDGEMRSVVDLLQSRVVFERVVDELGADIVLETAETAPLDAILKPILDQFAGLSGDNPPAKREQAIRRLGKTLHVHHQKKSHVVTVSYKARSPQVAQQILSSYVDTCLEHHLHVHRSPNSYEFFEEQTKLVHQKVIDSKQALRDAKNQIGVVSIPSQRKLLEEQITNLDRARLNAETDLASSRDRIESLRGELPFEMQQPAAASGLSTRSIDEMRNQLYTLELSYRDLVARFTSDHPRVVAVGEQVRESKLLLSRQELGIELSNAASLRSRIQSLGEQEVAIQTKLLALNEAEIRIAELERQAQEATATHRAYVTSLEQARINRELESDRITNLRMAQEPTLMGRPVSRRGGLIMVLAVVVGTLGGVGIAYLAELLDQSLGTPADIETELGLPVLASVPRSRLQRVSLN